MSNADAALVPASNQKLVTALGALAVLGPEERFETRLTSSAVPEPIARPRHPAVVALSAGLRVPGDVHLVGGGDPGLTLDGSSSIAALADALASLGVREITGDLVVDVSRHDDEPSLVGWKPGFVPGSVGPLSALAIGGNRLDTSESFLAAPDLSNGMLLLDALGRREVVVNGTVVVASRANTAPRHLLARVVSEPVAAMIDDLLADSDNLTSELLLREIGLAEHGTGSTEAGARVLDGFLDEWAGPLAGETSDGSGLSTLNRRSAREWVHLLRSAERSPVWATFRDGLAVAGRTGTLERRFGGTTAEGRVRAKTGTTDDVRSLSGVLTTADGRNAVFSIVANRTDLPRSSRDAIDELVLRIVEHPGS